MSTSELDAGTIQAVYALGSMGPPSGSQHELDLAVFEAQTRAREAEQADRIPEPAPGGVVWLVAIWVLLLVGAAFIAIAVPGLVTYVAIGISLAAIAVFQFVRWRRRR